MPDMPALSKASCALSPDNNDAIPEPNIAPGAPNIEPPIIGAAICRPFSNIPRKPLSIIS